MASPQNVSAVTRLTRLSPEIARPLNYSTPFRCVARKIVRWEGGVTQQKLKLDDVKRGVILRHPLSLSGG